MVSPRVTLGYFGVAPGFPWALGFGGVMDNKEYWKANIRLMLVLLAIWFTVSFGFGILLVDQLNQIPFSVLSSASGGLSKALFTSLLG